MYKCKHFKLHELVPKHYFEKYGDACWELLDERALITLDALRDKFGSMTVNNYFWGGNRSWSGLRTPEYYGSESKYRASRSQHKYGRAFDVIFKDTTAKAVREYVLKNRKEFPYITFLECDISWFHFDCRNTAPIKLWSPTRGFVNAE